MNQKGSEPERFLHRNRKDKYLKIDMESPKTPDSQSNPGAKRIILEELPYMI